MSATGEGEGRGTKASRKRGTRELENQHHHMPRSRYVATRSVDRSFASVGRRNEAAAGGSLHRSRHEPNRTGRTSRPSHGIRNKQVLETTSLYILIRIRELTFVISSRHDGRVDSKDFLLLRWMKREAFSLSRKMRRSGGALAAGVRSTPRASGFSASGFPGTCVPNPTVVPRPGPGTFSMEREGGRNLEPHLLFDQVVPQSEHRYNIVNKRMCSIISQCINTIDSENPMLRETASSQ
jgi:hypothetical protein